MTSTMVIILLMAFAIKHFVIDFVLQGPYQYLNKGKYMHPGGVLHSTLHALGTIVVVLCFGYTVNAAIVYSLIDFFAHYHIDYVKVNLVKMMEWGPTTHNQFWIAVGFDQMLHFLTYLLIATLMI